MTAVVLAFVGGLVAAWVGATIAYRRDVRRRMVSVVARAEVIVRRDMQPPLLQLGTNERAQWVLDRSDDRVRACEEELRGLSIEGRRHRVHLRGLAGDLDETWQAYAFLVYLFRLPPERQVQAGDDRALAYLNAHTALTAHVARVRKRLESHF